MMDKNSSSGFGQDPNTAGSRHVCNMGKTESSSGFGQTSKIKILDKMFYECDLIRKAETCSNIFQEFASKFVGHTFEQFVKECKSGIDGPSADLLYTIHARLNLICRKRSYYLLFRPYVVFFDSIPDDLRQWALHAAAGCTSLKFERQELSKRSMFTFHIGLFKVPALLDIMLNCTLFEDVCKYINKIVDAYLEGASSISEFDYFELGLVLNMMAFLDKIDDEQLPDKARFKDQLLDIMQTSGNNLPKCSNDAHDASVARLEEDLQNPDYINWIRGTMTFRYVNEGARHFSKMTFHKFLIDSLPNGGSHFDNGEYIQKMCEEGCLGKNPKERMHCSDCKILFDEVKKLQLKPGNTGFYNCKDIPVGGAWGIAKLFMPRHCENVRTPEDSDTQALFHLILNCSLFSQLSVDNIKKIVGMRNILMHSPNLSMTNDQLNELYDSELKFLEEAKLVNADKDVNQKLSSSEENIKKVRTLDIQTENIQELAKEAVEIEYEETERRKARGANDDSIVLEVRLNSLIKKIECYKKAEKLKSMQLLGEPAKEKFSRKAPSQCWGEKKRTKIKTSDVWCGQAQVKAQIYEFSGNPDAEDQREKQFSGEMHDLDLTHTVCGEKPYSQHSPLQFPRWMHDLDLPLDVYGEKPYVPRSTLQVPIRMHDLDLQLEVHGEKPYGPHSPLQFPRWMHDLYLPLEVHGEKPYAP